MVGPVHWGSYPGEFLEQAMAVLVAQDYPNVIRRTPARGDGGIDLMIPQDGGFIVEQVKGFHDRIGNSEQRQIERSWTTLMKKPRVSKPIIEYRLVIPVDPTPGEQDWFEELTASAPFPRFWRGKPHWDSLASRHPHVIDYYFGGGRDRVEQRAKALVAAVIDPTRPLTPADVAASLEIMRTRLNIDDPHYRYEFITGASSPAPPAPGDDCVMARTQQMTDGGFLTIRVVPRHAYATVDRPITGSLEIDLGTDPALAAEFRSAFDGFKRFGRALHLPDGLVVGNLDAPGGLGGAFEAGGGYIGPSFVDSPPDKWRLVLVDGSESPIATVPLLTESATTGLLGGVELKLADPSKTLRVEIQLEPPVAPDETGAVHGSPGSFRFNMQITALEGKPADEVVNVARLAANLAPPNELRWMMEFGPQILTSYRPTKDESLVGDGFAMHVADLAFIQDRAVKRLLAPGEVDGAFARDLHRHVLMLQGEVLLGTWDEIFLTLRPGVDRAELIAGFSPGGSFAVSETRSVQFDDLEIELGEFTSVLGSIEVASDQDDPSQIRLVPANGNLEMSQRAGGMSD